MSTNNAKNSNVYYTGRTTYNDGKLICLNQKTNSNYKDISQDYVIKSNGQSGYEFPDYDNVPSGYYFSEIIHAEYKRKSSGEFIRVYYEIIPYPDCYNLALGNVSEDHVKIHHIIQSYPVNSKSYEELACSIEEFLGKNEFKVKEMVGATEYILLNYEYGKIGGYRERNPITWEEYADYCTKQEEKEQRKKEEIARADAEYKARQESEYIETNSDKKEKYDYSYDW